MKSPLVSIIVPVYNDERYLAECIKSIQEQTYWNIQIILIDDGSTDQSGIICDKYADNDNRIVVIHQQNEGPVGARKSGLKKAEGKYIGFVDGDDSIAPDMYQALVHEMETSQADFVHSGYWEEGLKKGVLKKRTVDLSVNRKEFLKMVVFGGYISHSVWSKLYKEDLIKKSFSHIPDSCSLGEDFLIFCTCILESNKVVLLDEAYYHYRNRKGSLSHKNDVSDIKNHFKRYEFLCDILSSYGYYNDMQNVLDEFLWDTLLGDMGKISKYPFQIARYYFKDINRVDGRKVVIYGGGTVGRDYYAQISRYTMCRIVAWVDAYPEKYHYPYTSLQGIEVLNTIDFDLLIIAIKNELSAYEIHDQLIKKGIDKNKICWLKPERLLLNCTDDV